jgi:dCTP deaminase
MLSGVEIEAALRRYRCKRCDATLPRLVISGFQRRRLNPNSYNLRLADRLLVYDLNGQALDTRKATPTKSIQIPRKGLQLEPGWLYLGSTVEYTETFNAVPCIEGRSSMGRLGLCVHITAGFGDIGFCGTWTLEITVVHPLIVYPGEEVCQIAYHEISRDHVNYAGRYQRQRAATASRSYWPTAGSSEAASILAAVTANQQRRKSK